MSKRIFVGSIAWATTSDSLKNHFAQVGPVAKADVLTDKMTGRSRGFGFVEMESDADADAAIAKAQRLGPRRSQDRRLRSPPESGVVARVILEAEPRFLGGVLLYRENSNFPSFAKASEGKASTNFQINSKLQTKSSKCFYWKL